MLVRLSSDPRTRYYAARLRTTGNGTKEVLRCIQRVIAREALHLLVHLKPVEAACDLRALRHEQGLTPTQGATDLGTVSARIVEIERGTRLDYELATAFRHWLNAA